VQEAHPDAASAVLLAHVLCHVGERQVHRVRAEEHLVGGYRALLEYLAHLIEEVLLQLQVLEDRLDHHLARWAGGRIGEETWGEVGERGGGGSA